MFRPAARPYSGARALSLFGELGARYLYARTCCDLGETCYLAGDIETSRDVWQQALAILGDLKHPDATDVRAKLADLDRRYAVR